MSMISLVISLFAVSLSAYAIYTTRRHNRLSLVPHLSGCQRTEFSDSGLTLSYDVVNQGIGPAKVNSFILLRDGKSYPKERRDYVEGLIREHIGSRLKYQIKRSSYLAKDCSLRAGEASTICEIFFPGAKPADEEICRKAFSGLGLRIEYESFYGQKFTFDTTDKD